MLVLGALLSETDTYHLAPQLPLLDDDGDDFGGFGEANDNHDLMMICNPPSQSQQCIVQNKK